MGSAKETLDEAVAGEVWTALFVRETPTLFTHRSFGEALAVAVSDDLKTGGIIVAPYVIPMGRTPSVRSFSLVSILGRK